MLFIAFALAFVALLASLMMGLSISITLRGLNWSLTDFAHRTVTILCMAVTSFWTTFLMLFIAFALALVALLASFMMSIT